ncbi:MAG: DNA primase [Bacteroidaceae bacterium]|nr:DNA primase [Bacteroidaceae bacterium]
MIPQSTIDRIIDAANIVDVVSDYVTLRRAGASYKGLCPFHDDKTPSFSVSPARGVCKCFSCGKGGNSVHFIMEMEQMTYVEALKHLAKKYGIPVEEEQMTDEQRQHLNERESMFAVNEWAAKYFSQTMQNNQDGRAIGLAYFRSRGFRDDIIAKFRLGFCLDSPNAMSNEAKAKGYKEKYLVDTGLCVKRDNGTIYDRFRGRAMFPWIAVNGKVVAFGGRVLDARTKGVSQKYVNSPDSIIYHKANELYGIYQAKKQIAKEDMVYMVEGYTDVLAMHQCGIENVVANSGTALNEAQIHLLHRFTNNITLLYDGDEAGIHAATRSTDMLLAEGMNVKILLLPDGDDPDSFARKHNAQEFKEYVAAHQTDFILFKSNLLLKDAQRDPIKRAKLTEDIVRSIAVIPDEIIRSTYVHECAEILGMDEAVLMRGANKNRAAILENMKKEAQRERERQDRLLNMGQEAEKAKETPAAADVQASDPSLSETPSDADDSFAAITSVNEAPAQQATDIQPLITKKNAADQRFIGIERMIMTLVTRYGELPIDGENANGEQTQTTLAEYVQGDLTYDGITLRSPLYTKMLQLTCAHIHDDGFVASKFLLNNQDEDVSREAADLISDRYQLSKGNQMTQSEEELKSTYVSRLLLDYKNAIVEEELKLCNADLTRPEIKSDIPQMMAIMRRIKELGEIQRELAKYLGDRVVAK